MNKPNSYHGFQIVDDLLLRPRWFWPVLGAMALLLTVLLYALIDDGITEHETAELMEETRQEAAKQYLKEQQRREFAERGFK